MEILVPLSAIIHIFTYSIFVATYLCVNAEGSTQAPVPRQTAIQFRYDAEDMASSSKHSLESAILDPHFLNTLAAWQNEAFDLWHALLVRTMEMR